MSDDESRSGGNIIKAQLSMFSILPIDGTKEDVDKLCDKFWTIPISGLIFGIILGIIFLSCTYAFSILPAAVITVFSAHILNRFLHFDGLMDFGDGLVAHGDKEKKIRALKDSNVGSGAVGVGIMVSILTIVTLSSCVSSSGPENWDSSYYWQLAVLMFPICAEVLAKNGLYAAAAFGEPTEGGLGEMFVKSANKEGLGKSTAISAVIVVLLSACTMYNSAIGLEGAIIMGLLMVLASVGIGYLINRISMKSFGFVNGDVLGAANELSRTGVLLVALFVIIWMTLV